MDALKRFLVLLTSFIILAIIVYLVSVSSPKTIRVGPPLASRQDNTPSKKSPEFETPNQFPTEDSLKAPEIREIPKTTRPADSIVWHQAPKNNLDTTYARRFRTPPIGGNPNSVFIEATRRILPSVVSIVSQRKMRWIPRGMPDDENKDDKKDEEFYHPGSGSGIIISEDGYILTNYHVVEKAREIRVKLFDKREFYASFIGGDPTTDIAVLKIKAQDLPYAYFGDSDSIQIGEWVIAVGNPLNFTSTVTTGIVSALGRDINIINEQYRIENFIQTDAVINPGNSGGALVNLNGEVIGINTAIATRTGLYQGYGFAIPINLAKKVANDILKFGHVRRGLLGVTIAPVDDRVARGSGLPRPMGALIQGVNKGYPAEQVGLKPGDIILAVNDNEVVSVNDLQLKIARHYPGETVKLLIWREGKKFNVTVRLAEAPVTPPEVEARNPQDHIEFENLGMKFRDLKKSEKEKYQIKQGILIENTLSGSPARMSGLRKGDVIISVNNEPITSVEQFQEILNKAQSGDVLKLVVHYIIDDQSIQRIVFVEVP